jgi:NADP-dependent 3-hydroxy acid dehydrogenase YdfG
LGKAGIACELNAIVTGASSGIGRAIAIAIAEAGGSACLVGRNAQGLAATAEVARQTARAVSIFQADLIAEAAIADLTRHVEYSFNSLNTLVNCASVFAVGRLENMSIAEFDNLYRTNVRTPFTLIQALLPALKANAGQIVFINSSQGLQARANTSAYAATKHALRAVADSLRQEVNADGIRVLSIHAGRTASKTVKALSEVEGRAYRPELLLQPEDIAQVVLQTLKLPRTAEITNIEIRPLTKSY